MYNNKCIVNDDERFAELTI